MTIPKFIRCLAAECRHCGEVIEVSRGYAELIPEGGGGIAGQPHGSSLPKDHLMDTFGITILSRCIGGSDEVINTVRKAPRCHGVGH